ncbi:MAG: SOS response-associated peptidase [Acidimicrobiia bacterium]
MCGRFTSRTPVADVAAWFGVDEVVAAADRPRRYNVAPTDEVLVVASSAGGERRRLGEARWGLVPGWADGPGIGARMINARAETLLEKAAFRRSFARRRCLVPADGFYEWEKAPPAGEPGPGARKAGSKQPWLIEPAGGGLFAFAGLWDSWHPPGDGTQRLVSCTIVTTGANATMAALHDRMPAMLAAEHWDAWLDPDNDDLAGLRGLLVPAPDDAIVLRPVSRAVGDVRNDGPGLLEAPPDAPASPAGPAVPVPEAEAEVEAVAVADELFPDSRG